MALPNVACAVAPLKSVYARNFKEDRERRFRHGRKVVRIGAFDAGTERFAVKALELGR